MMNDKKAGKSARIGRRLPIFVALIIGLGLIPLFHTQAASLSSSIFSMTGLGSRFESSYRLLPSAEASFFTPQEDPTPEETPEGPNSDLGVTKQVVGSDSVGADSNVTYSIEVRNSGPNEGVGVTLTDALPAGMTFVSMTQNSGPTFSCSNPSVGTNGTVTCTLSSMEVNATAVFTLVAHISENTEPGTSFNNVATVSTSSVDFNDENNSSSAGASVVTTSADVSVVKTVDSGTARPDTDVTYTIEVRNNGPDAASGVTLNDTLPGDMTFVSMTQNSGPTFSCSTPSVGMGGSISCTNASLAVNEVAVFTLVGHIPALTSADTTYTNTATVSTTTEESNEENNSSSAISTVVTCDTESVVTTTADSGPGSLRQAILGACNNGAIFFAPSVVGTINLTSGELLINKNLTIMGPGAHLLTVRRAAGASSFRIFTTTAGLTVNISGLTLSNGLSASGADGGAIFNQSGTLLNLSNMKLISNATADASSIRAGFGGAIANLGTLNLISSTVSGNVTGKGAVGGSGSGGDGGGIYNSGVMTIVSSTISGNATGNGSQAGVSSIHDGYGGGLYNGGGNLTLINSTVSSNTTSTGGSTSFGGQGAGVYNQTGSALSLTNCTVANNIASGGVNASAGGGIYNGGSPAASLGNTIIANNAAANSQDVFGNFNSQGFNLIRDTTGATITGTTTGNITGQDPRLGPLGNNGGATQTHQLLAGSPALDGGNNALLPADSFDLDNDGITAEPLPVDQRGPGFLRVMDAADADTTQTVDIGAFEAQVSVEDITDKAINEDTPFSFSFNVGDASIINTVTAASSNTTLVSNIVITGTGSTRTLQLTPTANLSGQTTITVTVFGNSQSMSDTFVLTVNAVNDAPVADSQSVTTNEDTPKAITLTGSDVDSGSLSYIIVSNPSHGSLSGVAPNVTYTPDPNYSGTDSFTFKINDGSVDSNVATVSITVNAVNDVPQAAGDSYSTDENTALNVPAPGVLVNDTDVESATLTAVKASDPSHGTVTLNSNGSFTYTPQAGFSGTDSFTYKANDGSADSNAATVSITVNEGGAIQFSSTAYNVDESAGNATINITRTGGTAGIATVLFQTSNGTAGAADYTTVSQTVTFNAGETSKTVNVPITDDTTDEPDETVNLTLSNAGGTGQLGTPSTAVLTINDGDDPGVQFNSNSYSFSEGAGHGDIKVIRTGDTSAALTVDYITSDQSGTTPCQTNNTGFASDRCDYATATGTLRFAAGELEKTIPLIIIDDAYVEGPEALTIKLINPVGATLGSTDTATVTITDNDTQVATTNPIDNLDFFIRQQYIDFLGREPDAAGFQFWKDRMTTQCPAGQTCDRIDTALRFFASDEFRERGYFVYLFYHAALGRRPTYAEWIMDVSKLNGPKTIAEQNAARDAFINEFMSRQEFMNLYNGAQTGQTFVDALIQKSGVTPASRQTLINNYGTVGRANTLRAFIETTEVQAAYLDRGFVTMLYFGFLRRDAEAGGFAFWMQKLNDSNHDYRLLVGGFINSDEYRYRYAEIKANP